MKTLKDRFMEAFESGKIDVEDLKEMAQEVNSWNGSFEHLEFYENDEYFFEDCFASKHDAVRAAIYGDYNYTDDYVRFDGYGHIESLSEYEIDEAHEDEAEEIIETYAELVEDGSIRPWGAAIVEIVEEYEEDEEDTEDEEDEE